MPNNLTADQAHWLVDNCMPEHATAEAPGWPPGRFFRKVLRGQMRDSGKLETAYLMLQPGKHVLQWDGRNDHGGKAATGTYFYRLNVEGKTQVRRLLLLR